MARAVQDDSNRLGAITVARTTYQEAVVVAKQKLADYVIKETEEYYLSLIEAIRLAVVDGLSARQIGMAYGSSDPHTIKRLIDAAGVDNKDVQKSSSWKTTWDGDKMFALRVVAFGADRQTGEATFVVDDDGENITATHGDFWLQSLVYKEDGLVERILKHER
jgi:predicted DNA-binding protein (UPF0251 family)